MAQAYQSVRPADVGYVQLAPNVLSGAEQRAMRDLGHGRLNGDIADAQFWSLRKNESSCGEPYLRVVGSPQLVGGYPEAPSEGGNQSSKNGAKGAIMVIKELADLDNEDHRHMVSGALFLFCLSVFLTYFFVSGGDRK
ncbi:MAG: hypothetical protein ACLQF1_01815 [Methyloceanibacter sp.]